MKKVALLFTLSVALLTSFSTLAAETTELKVKGTIRPAACTPSFIGGAVVDYGVIRSNTLKAGQINNLAVKTIDLAVTCDASAKIAIRAVDNRASSVPTDFDSTHTYGLGMINGTKIGAYWMGWAATTIDGVAATHLVSHDGSRTWQANYQNFSTTRTYTWSKTAASAVPVAFTTLRASVNLQVQIDKPENLPLTQEIPLDGSVTFEVMYL